MRERKRDVGSLFQAHELVTSDVEKELKKKSENKK